MAFDLDDEELKATRIANGASKEKEEKMNREIKFRAWYKDIKEMFEVGQITLKKGIWDYQPEDRKYIGISIPYQPSFILMQFTGLHDKNGKEIYERRYNKN